MSKNISDTSIHRTFVANNILIEYAFPRRLNTKQSTPHVAILCSGAPTMPGKGSVIAFLQKRGFIVVVPRYRGTWESGGTFLKNEPTQDILDVIETLDTPLISAYTGRIHVVPTRARVVLFASSFGGPAGFALSTHKRVEAVVALSPVCDWRVPSPHEPLEDMSRIIRLAWGHGYRSDTKGWEKLQKGSFYNPETAQLPIDATKCIVLIDREDMVVPYHSLTTYAVPRNVCMREVSGYGHMGLSVLCDPKIWRKVKIFLNRTTR
jgi:pimeloyl-ACP methyl ester carboxylesterase